nr:PREDICTED: 5-hydroxytryptamine receptor 3C-like [Anolis carolinensis]|eukprot:XP_016846842.1 PREDICTED: 5-hydroxytryptamine receptor 3C-like [Anolis carolinensis]
MWNDEITIEVDAKSRNTYLTNGEWKFNRISFSSDIMSGVQMKYSAVTYQIFMQRRPVLYVLNLIIPTSALFFLDLVISFTSASPSEKINFKITLILEISVLSLILNEILPASSDEPPLIAKFFMGIFLLMVTSLLENYLTMTLKMMNPPSWFLKWEKCVCLKNKQNTSEDSASHIEEMLQNEKISTDNTPTSKENEEKEAYVFLRSVYCEVKLMREQLSAYTNPVPENANWSRLVVGWRNCFVMLGSLYQCCL